MHRLGGGVFDEEAARACPQGPHDVFVAVERGEHDDSWSGFARLLVDDPSRGVDPVDVQHPAVHRDYVRAKPSG
jgi:hypothetical protein